MATIWGDMRFVVRVLIECIFGVEDVPDCNADLF
jgi:hypothetical protein